MKNLSQMFKDVSKGLIAGALLGFAVFAAYQPEVVARAVGGVYGDRLHIEATPLSATPDVTVGEDDAYINGTLEVDGAARFDGAVTLNGGISGAVSATTLSASGASTLNGAWTLGDADADQGTIESSSVTVANNGVTFSSAAAGVGTILRLDALNQRVGIGSASPAAALDVVGDGTLTGLLTASSATVTNNLLVSSGKVGVGSASPAVALDVVGAGAFTTTVTAGTGLTVTSGNATLTSGNLILTAGYARLYSRSIAQLLAIAPGAVGEMYFCNDCSPAKMVVSTGTSAGTFADPAGATFQ